MAAGSSSQAVARRASSAAVAAAPLTGGRSWWTFKPSSIAPILAITSTVLYCCNSELLQALQTHLPHDQGKISVLGNLILCHLGGLVFVPSFIWKQPIVPYGGMDGAAGGLTSDPRVMSLLFAFLLMGYNYAWLLSTRFVAVGVTNALFQSSIALVYIASVPLFGERLTAPRLTGVALALMGSALASGSAVSFTSLTFISSENGGVGVCLALMAAAGVASYQVIFKHFYSHLKQDGRFLAYFMAWVSVWHLVVIFPLVLLAHLLGFEELSFPYGLRAIAGTLLSAIIASTVNMLTLGIVMWGSPMLLSCSSALSVPLVVLLDLIMHGKRPTESESWGHSLVVVSVVLIMELHTTFLCRPKSKGETNSPGLPSEAQAA